MEERVVNVPLAAGINQEDDQFSVSPPEMESLINVQAVKKGALDTRMGFNLLTAAPVDYGPATSFSDTSGSTATVSEKIEALGPYTGATGSRPLLVSNGTLFDYVGSDGVHGWRQINQVPEYVGTLSSAASTGGAIIEIESLLFDNDTKRITAWVTGERTGQELSSDRPMLDQITGDGNSVYYSVQDVATEAYIVPPTRLNSSTTPAIPVVSAINLRVIALQGESATRTQPMIFWFDYTREAIESVVISLVNCAPSATTSLRTDDSIIKTHRCFDVVAISKNGSAPYFTFFYAFCSKDSNSNTIKARTKGWVRRVNASNVMQAELFYVDLIDVAPPGVSGGFVPWAMRGVVLEQAPEVTVIGGGNWTATMSIGIRVIARWYDQENPTGSNKLDGQLALGRVTVTGTAAGLPGSYTITRAGYKFIPHIGFQTNDDLSLVLPASPNQRRFSGGPKTRRKLSTSVSQVDVPVNTLPSTPPYFSAFPIPSFNSEWAVAITLADNSRQTYMCNLSNTYNSLVQSVAGYYELAPKSSLPFSGPEFSGINGRSDCFKRIRSNYPRTVRKYPGDLEVEWNAVNTIPEPSRQVNFLDFDSASGNTGFSDGIYIGALIQMAGVTVATATICVSGGSIVAAAIENPLAGPAPGGYAFGAGTYKVAGFQVSAPGLGAVALTGARIWNLTQSLANPQPLGADVPDKTGLPPDTVNFYYVYGQEHCVHRWSVAHNASTDVVVLSSCAATQTTNPQGDVPFGASSPMRFNNFCEFYRYSNAAGISYTPLVNFGGGISVGQLSCAVGGPWRLVGGLAQDNGKFYAAICPAGDDSQASTFLVRLGVDDSVALSWPNGASSEPPPTANQVQYTGNKGLFVEAANLVRVTAPPLNVPSLSYTTRGLIMGAIRLGSSKGTQECFALEYEYLARNWRQLVRMSDYTFVNGGALSVYDGVNCNEVCSFVWPQRDLTSISWSDGTTQTQYLSSDSSLRPFQSFVQPMGGVLGSGGSQYMLYNITRPYWLYEAGLNGIKNYGGESTQWGGDPSDNYEAIYNDGRTQQFSTANKAAYRGGPDLYGKHYYGRYQSTPTDFGTANKYPLWRPDGFVFPYSSASSYFLWAPRSAKGWSWQDVAESGIKGNGESKYSQTETGGDFLMSWCYEYADGTGRISRSAPSSPIQFTVCAEIESTGGAIKSSEGKRRMGGFVTRFKWGFFVPRLELTNRSSSASTDPRRVTLQPYSTCEPYSTVMYRMPWDNFMNPINDFVVPRNATRGVVPYATAPFQGTIDDNPCGYVVTNMAMSRKPSGPAGMAADLKPCNALFDGPTGDYMGMLREPYLYTTGGVLDNVTPPGCKAMCVHQNRLVIGGADDPTVVWFTKELTPTDAPGFNDLLTINIESGGAVTGLASMNSNLFIFKKNDVYVISGSMPDATGQSSSLSDPVRLPSGIGCVDHRSVLATPIGIFFQSTRSIELLTPDLRITPVGDKVLDMLATTPYVTSVSHNATTQEVYFLCHGSRVNRGTTTTPFQILVYSYLINAWYRWTLAGGSGMGAMTVVGETPYIGLQNSYNLVQQAHVYKQINNQYVDGRSGISDYNYIYPGAFFKTAKFSLNQVQGFQRVKRIRLLADIANTSSDLPGVDVELTTDLNTTQSVSWTQAQVAAINTQQGVVPLEVHVEKQKGQALAFQASLVAPTVVNTAAPRVRFSNLALVVGLKQGLNKRITEDAKK